MPDALLLETAVEIDGDETGMKVLRRELGVGEDCWLSKGDGAPKLT